jgi:hypothetical protein
MGGRGRYRPYEPPIIKVTRFHVEQRVQSGPWFIKLIEPNGQPGGRVTELGSEPKRYMARERAQTLAAERDDGATVLVGSPLHWGMANDPPADMDYS